MTPPQRGNPYLQVRLPQETIDELKEFVGEGDGGKAGGVSLFARRLLYREIDQDMPKQWGQDATTMADLFTLRRQVRAGNQGAGLLRQLAEQTKKEKDPVRLSFLREIAGELSLILLEQKALEEVASRKAAAKKTTKAKKEKLLAYAQGVSIHIPRLDKEDLILQACAYYNAHNLGLTASPTSDPKLLERIAVSYLRHTFGTEQHGLALDLIGGRVGKVEAHRVIIARVLDEIGEVYPWLLDECHRLGV